MKEIVDLVKKVLELLPASLKAGKGALRRAAVREAVRGAC